MQETLQQYNATIYVRLSKEDEDADKGCKEESNSIINQKQLILDFLKDKADINVVSVRVDDGYTGTNFERPAFQRMMEDIRAGKVNCVVIKDLSRFGREYINAGKYIDRLFPIYGVRLIAINDHIDTMTKSTSDDFNIMLKNLMNDNYCRDISIKIRSQLQVKRRNGEFLSPFAPYGYTKADNNRNQLVIDPYPANVVQDIFRMKLEGMSQDSIAKYLTEHGVLSPMEYKRSQGLRYKTSFKTNKQAKWSPVAVRRILTNPVYKGTLVQGVRTRPNYKIKKVVINDAENWCIVDNAHEPIVSDRIFALVQKLLALDTRTSPNETSVFPLAGLIECGDCHSSMVRIQSSAHGRKYTYYVCSENKHTKACSSHRIPEKVLEDTVLFVLQEHIRLIVEMDECLKSVQGMPFLRINIRKAEERMIAVEEEIERYRKLKISAYEDMKDGIISKTDFFDIRSQYDERITDALLAKDQIQNEMEAYISDSSATQKWMQDFIEHKNIQKLTRLVAIECIEKILVFEDKKIEVVFTHAQSYQKIMRQLQEYLKQNGKFQKEVS